jgi:hypothetical protein
MTLTERSAVGSAHEDACDERTRKSDGLHGGDEANVMVCLFANVWRVFCFGIWYLCLGPGKELGAAHSRLQ